MPEYTVAELARAVGGELVGPGDAEVRGVATLDTAGPHDLSLVASRRYVSYVPGTRAAAVLVGRDLAETVPPGPTQIRVADAHVALAEIVERLFPPEPVPPGVHPTAIVEPDVELGADVAIEAYAVIGRDSRLGDGVRIGAHAVVGGGCVLGAHTWIHPHATLYPGVEVGERCIIHSGARLGSDGFGYAWTGAEHRKIPQVGGCRLGAGVEVGANSTIDRGSIGATTVGDGTKIDNLVHLGHNVRVGAHAIIVAQTGIAGSSVVGEGVVLGGQVGVGGHLTIGPGARVAAQAGVIGDVEPGSTVSGYPARPHRDAMRASAALFRFPELVRRLQRLEQVVFGGPVGGGAAGPEPQGRDRDGG